MGTNFKHPEVTAFKSIGMQPCKTGIKEDGQRERKAEAVISQV